MSLLRARLATRFFVLLSPAALALTISAIGEELQPQPVHPDTVPYVAVGRVPGLRIRWVVGSETGNGPYLIQVESAAGTKLPSHTHPDARLTQVVSGTLYVGFGPAFDGLRAVPVPAGSVYVVPAGVPHYAWARDGDVLYEESGIGPTANVFPETSAPATARD